MRWWRMLCKWIFLRLLLKTMPYLCSTMVHIRLKTLSRRVRIWLLAQQGCFFLSDNVEVFFLTFGVFFTMQRYKKFKYEIFSSQNFKFSSQNFLFRHKIDKFRHKMPKFVTKSKNSSQLAQISSQKFTMWFFKGTFAMFWKRDINFFYN